MRHFRLLLLIFLFALPTLAQAKHPFTFEDMMKLKRVEEPQVSPDGKWVLFAAVDVDLAANTKTPHVWIVPTAGGQEKEIISDQDADRPRWSPDGKRFAFISTKENGSQVWIADFDGAQGVVKFTYQLTSIATEASSELWSPDGNNILFISDVYPECDGKAIEEQDCNAKKLKEANDSKVKAQIFTHLLYRHWNAYKEGKRTHIFVVGAVIQNGPNAYDQMRGIPRDLTPGDYDAPVFSLGGQDDYAFSPDGKEICYTSNHDPMPADSTNNDLFTVPVDSGVNATAKDVLAGTKDITADNKASDSTPLYSPDGKYIAYRAQKRSGYESDRFRLMLYDRKTEEKKNLTGNFDQWIGSFNWAGGPYLILVAEKEGGSPIYLTRIDCVNQCPVRKLIDGFNDDINYSVFRRSNVDGSVTTSQALFFTRNSLQAPAEIFTDINGTCDIALDKIHAVELGQANQKLPDCALPKPKQITHLNNAVLSQVSMSPLEPFWFTGAHGDQVEGFLVKPPNFDLNKKYPVKFLIHGGPQGAWGDDWSYRWNPELFAAPTRSNPAGYVVIMINFHGSTGYGQKFIDAINGDWGGAPFEDLMKGLDYAESHYGFIDKDRECALGASYGGYMANWILGHTNRFKCIVSHDGMFNAESAWGSTEELWFNEWEFKGTPYTNRAMYEKWSPHRYAANFKTPTLVIHGQKDYRLDVSQGFELFTTLQRLGVPSKMLYFPDEGHWVLKPQNSQLWYKTVNDWVDQWTKNQ
jgi:dipeptidyl aminopeptidase/acylaminoacyl peptidase